MDVMTAAAAAKGDHTMTSNTETQIATPETATAPEAAATGKAKQPKAARKATVAPQKPPVAPAKAKASKKGHPGEEGAQRRQGREVRQANARSPPGQQDRHRAGAGQTRRRCHARGDHEGHRLAGAFGARIHLRDDGEEAGVAGSVRETGRRRARLQPCEVARFHFLSNSARPAPAVAGFFSFGRRIQLGSAWPWE